MDGKNPHVILGVNLDATPEQIRNSYLLRCKMLHPDRFDPATQKEEWNLANEMLMDLNQAYAELRDKPARVRLRTVPRPEPSPSPSPSAAKTHPHPPPPPRPDAAHAGIKSGVGRYRFLPVTCQRRLAARIAQTEALQFAVPLRTLRANYLMGVLLVGWLGVLVLVGSMQRWEGLMLEEFLAITIVVAVCQALNFNWIVRWRASPLRSWLFITPLYVIKTHLDQVWFWPFAAISDVERITLFRLGRSARTMANLELGVDLESFPLANEAAYDDLRQTLDQFGRQWRDADTRSDHQYFVTHDDFRQVERATPLPPAERSTGRTAGVFALVFLIYGGTFAGGYALSQQQPSRSLPMAFNPGLPTPPVPISTPALPKSPLPFPTSGEINIFKPDKLIAPLEIHAAAGSSYLVKLVDPLTDATVLTVFVRSGDTVRVDVPLGKFLVKSAAGEKWYGYDVLFGPATNYSQAPAPYQFTADGKAITGHTIMLNNIKEGRPLEERIAAKDF